MRTRHVLFGVLLTVASAAVRCLASGEGLTVSESIELVTFSDPNTRDPLATVKLSPNRKHLAIVTTRGLLDSNQIESTLWILDTQAVRAYVNAGHDVPALVSRQVAKFATTPRAEQDDSYGTLIKDLVWATDSSGIYFLGENADGHRQLYITDLSGTRVRAVSGPREDVEKFGASADSAVYEARPLLEATPAIGTPINSTAITITGQSLSSILFAGSTGRSKSLELGAVHQGNAVVIEDPLSSGRLQTAQFSNMAPSVSPSGRFVVVQLPAPVIPAAWEAYETTMPSFMTFKARSGDAAAKAGVWPSEYQLIDLVSGEVRPLLEAPNGLYGGYYDAEKAIWSPQGDAILLGNTYLPLEGVDSAERERRTRSCAFAIAYISGGKPSCVAFSRSANADNVDHLVAYDAQFVGSANKVVLQLHWHNNRQTEYYQYRAGQWMRTKSVDASTANEKGNAQAPGTMLSVSLKQDLNAPPALWATDAATGKSRKIWDPNPQLTNRDVGEASVYRWKDSAGYEWSASLIKPVGYEPGKRYPLVIQTHGFHNEHEFITDGAYTTAFAARPLAAAGIMVLETRDRHDHDVTADEAANMVRGFESAIESLDAAGLIDPDRVGIIGFSRTCYYTESALIHAPDRYAAAVIADGVDESYMQYLVWREGQEFSEEESIYGVKPFGPGLMKWLKAAPGFHLYEVRAPLLIQTITPASVLEEWEIYASLRLLRKPVEMLYVPDGQHILQKPLERLASQQSSVDWMRFWLQNYEDPDPSKSEQYKRWWELRKLQEAQDAERSNAAKEPATGPPRGSSIGE